MPCSDGENNFSQDLVFSQVLLPLLLIVITDVAATSLSTMDTYFKSKSSFWLWLIIQLDIFPQCYKEIFFCKNNSIITDLSPKQSKWLQSDNKPLILLVRNKTVNCKISTSACWCNYFCSYIYSFCSACSCFCWTDLEFPGHYYFEGGKEEEEEEEVEEGAEEEEGRLSERRSRGRGSEEWALSCPPLPVCALPGHLLPIMFFQKT